MNAAKLPLLLVLLLLTIGVAWLLLRPDYFSGAVFPEAYDTSIFVVDLTGVPDQLKLAAAVSAGHLNRHFNRPAVYTLLAPNDKLWAADLQAKSELANAQWTTLSAADLVAYAIAVGAVTGTVAYDSREPWSLANVVTICGLQSAVPVPISGLGDFENCLRDCDSADSSPENSQRSQLLKLWHDSALNFGVRQRGQVLRKPSLALDQSLMSLPLYHDVAGVWADDMDAGLYAWTNLVPLCEGTEDTIATQRPELLSQGYLADYIVSKKMFVFYLPQMCQEGPQNVLFKSIAQEAYDAGKQLKVMGYNTASEVVADCTVHHTEISLVSDWCPNLSFLSRMKGQETAYIQPQFQPSPVYNPNDTYLAIINSDGDNMQMENNGNREGMEARVSICAKPNSICPPLAWTISNKLATFAPFQLEWYYSQGRRTGKDAFLMGPSGSGFLHPAALEPDSPLLMQFITDTVEAAEQLQMTSYVHWDIDGNDLTQATMYQILNDSWTRTQSQPFNRTQSLQDETIGTQQLSTLLRNAYLKHFDGTQIDTIFAPGEYNVPSWIGNVAGIGEQYRWFKGTPIDNVVSIANNVPKGTVGYIYKIFDVDMNDLEAVAAQVNSHVHLLDHRQLHDIALQKKFYDASA